LESVRGRRTDGRGALSNLKSLKSLKSYLLALPLKGEEGVATTCASAKGGGGGDRTSKDKGKGLKVEDHGSDAVMAVRKAAGEEEEEDQEVEEDAERESSDSSEDLVDQVTPEH
jgi:hypothetical protein